MNLRQYEDAIQGLQERYTRNPQDGRVAFYLAQSHLGVAGMELLRFADDVLGDQKARFAMTPDLLLESGCDDGKIDKFDSTAWRCLMQRIYLRLPNPDERHLSAARDILRTAFPDPRQTGTEVNFLGAFVEWSSALSRMKILNHRLSRTHLELLPRDESRELFGVLVHQFKLLLDETTLGFKRAKHSYGKVSRYVKTLEGVPLIRVGDRELLFNEDLEPASLLGFMADVVGDNALSVNKEMNGKVAGLIGGALSQFDARLMDGTGAHLVRFAWRFDSAVSQVLNELGEAASGKGQFRLFGSLWKNPPSILRDFDSAIHAAWRDESPEALERYAASTGQAWKELDSIGTDWSRWIRGSFSKERRDVLFAWLRTRALTDSRLSAPPAAFDSPEVSSWVNGFILGLLDNLETFLAAPSSETGLSPLSEEQWVTGMELVQRTRSWHSAHWESRK